VPNRFSLTHYAGATSPLPLEKALKLGSGWGFMPKKDGSYVELATDARGRISSMVFRTGAQLERDEHDDLMGMAIGLPMSSLVGELEVYTEHAVMTVKGKRRRHLHLFDMLRHVGEYVAREPFSERYRRMMQWHSAISAGTTDGTWYESIGGAKDSATNEYVQSAKVNLRRLPLVPLATGSGALEELWRSEVQVGGGEGIVAVNLDAPIGARASKRKCKRHDTLDAQVVSIEDGAVRVLWAGEIVRIRCVRWLPAIQEAMARTGRCIVEVKSDGVYWTGRVVPKHARITRIRYDLTAGSVATAATLAVQ